MAKEKRPVSCFKRMKKHQIPIFAEGRNANALHSSIMQGYTDIFKILLGKGADIEKVNTRYDHNISPLELSLTFFKKATYGFCTF